MSRVIGCFACEWGCAPTLDDDVAQCLRHWREAEAWAAASVHLELVDPCPRCGGLGGVHGKVHVRHGNGGGHNKPCPESDGGDS